MTTRAETIANHVNAAGEHLKAAADDPRTDASIDAAMRCLHLAFLECLGGAECASPAPAAEGGLRAYKPECDSGDCILPMGHAEDHWDGHGAWPRVSPAAEGPWVVRVLDRDADADKTKTRWDAGGGGLSADRTNAVRYAERASAVGAATWFERAGYIATVLPLAEAERAETEGPLRTSYPHGAVVAPKPDAAENLSVILRREECERKAARQAKPAGWVVRLSNGQLRWLWMRASGAEYEPYATREDAQRIADTTGGEAVPVDAAGNVIEGGVAWEAARSYEEAERLRAELATWKRTAEQRMERIRSVKAERDDRSARCDAAEADVARLTKERDTARAERDTAKAERDKLTTDEADLRYALRTIAGPLHLRTRPRPCRARRGGCGGVSMGYGIDRGFGYSDSMHGSSASDLAEEVMRARQKFPGRRFLLAALTEEVGELAKAYLQREGDEAVRKEALQVACVAMRIYEEGDETFDDVTAAEAKK